MPESARPQGSRSDVARILVTCDNSPLGAAALDAAAGLACRLDAELAGVFVEDINLLRMAALPFAREYVLANAVARRVESAEIERALRRQAGVMREALSRAAHDLSLPWSFQVVRGALLESVLQTMREPDFAVFGHTGQYVVIPQVRVAKLAPPTRTAAPRQPIVTIYEPTPAAERALIAAKVLAQVHHTHVVVLLIAGDAAAQSRLRARAAELLKGDGVNVRFQVLPARDAQAIKNATDSNHAALLLWHGVQTADQRKMLATLVDALRCPVVLTS